jgi:ankyrin repeat protein
MENIRELLAKVDLEGIKHCLARHPELVNAGIALGSQDSRMAHPLHRICDGVQHGMYTDHQAREMAAIFVSFGSDVNGVVLVDNRDSPLTAAASLTAELTGIYYVDQGASVAHPGCHGGTALHWASWCGRDVLVKKLIDAGAPLEKRCKDYFSTPLFWAIHGYKFGGEQSRHHQVECARLLLEAGAVKGTQNAEGRPILELLDETDVELRAMLT